MAWGHTVVAHGSNSGVRGRVGALQKALEGYDKQTDGQTDIYTHTHMHMIRPLYDDSLEIQLLVYLLPYC